MTDLEALRRKYGGLPLYATGGEVIQMPPPKDPSVLALCDEVEALRSQVAAAPEVLREWPTVEMLPKLAGRWGYVSGAGVLFGEFDADPMPSGPLVCFVDDETDARFGSWRIDADDFFVKIPEVKT